MGSRKAREKAEGGSGEGREWGRKGVWKEGREGGREGRREGGRKSMGKEGGREDGPVGGVSGRAGGRKEGGRRAGGGSERRRVGGRGPGRKGESSRRFRREDVRAHGSTGALCLSRTHLAEALGHLLEAERVAAVAVEDLTGAGSEPTRPGCGGRSETDSTDETRLRWTK